jgi:hypothetical protein
MLMFSCTLALLLGAAPKAGAAPFEWTRPLMGPGASTSKPGGSSARMRVEDGSLVFDIDVADATPAPGAHPVHSDHVELWLALEEQDGLKPATLVANAQGALFLVDGKANPQELARRLAPAPAGEDNDACEKIENGLREAYRAPPYRLVQAFVGMTHFGLFPDGRPAVQYDLESYAGIGPRPLADHPADLTYSAERRAGGYRFHGVLKPQALLFIPRDGIRSLRVRIDQIDAAPGTKRERLLSTSPKPRWGDPATFTSVPLPVPLGVSVSSALPELGTGAGAPAGLISVWARLPRLYVLTAQGWLSISRSEELLRSNELRLCRGDSIPGVTAVSYPEYALKSRTLPAPGQRSASVFSVGDIAAVIIGEGERRQGALIDELHELFEFPDGALGALAEVTAATMGEPTSGLCGAGMEHSWYLVRFEEKSPRRIDLFTFDDCGFSVTPAKGVSSEFKVLTPQGDTEAGQESEGSAYRWLDRGRSLSFQFSEMPPFCAAWDAGGKAVKLGKIARETRSSCPAARE